MKNSSINCIQKQLNNGYKTIVKFGKKVQVELNTKQIEHLQNQLRISRLLEPKQLWTSVMLTPITNQLTGEILSYRRTKVQGTYEYNLHGELN